MRLESSSWAAVLVLALVWPAPAVAGVAAEASVDFAIALTSTTSRAHLINASRYSWRSTGQPWTVVATNASEQEAAALTANFHKHKELYLSISDEQKMTERQMVHSKRAGDMRAALLPTAAHEALTAAHGPGSYKWLLYGDDDTMFFLPALQRMLQDLDPEQPYILTDNVWLLQTHPNLAAPRCLPCTGILTGPAASEIQALRNPAAAAAAVATASTERGAGMANPRRVRRREGGLAGVGRTLSVKPESRAAPSLLDTNITSLVFAAARASYRPPAGCPQCTPDLACAHYVSHRVLCRWSGAHGGAGMVFSVGLLKRLPHDAMIKCVTEQWGCSGGDCLLSRCLWNLANITYTDPGYSTLAGHVKYTVFDNSRVRKLLLRGAASHIQDGRCDAHCQWLLRYGVSCHVGARMLRTAEQAEQAMLRMWATHQEAQALLAHGAAPAAVPDRH